VAVTERLDRFQRRHRAAALPIAVTYKYLDDYGGYLAALITYYAFVSLFPLLLLLSTILGWLLVGHPQWQQDVINSALSQFPVVGAQLSEPQRIGGGAIGLVIGILGSLYGGLGVAQAFQYAMNTAWAVPRNERPDPLRSRLRSLALVATGGLVLIGTTLLSTFGSSGAGSLGWFLRILVLIGSVVVNAAAFIVAFQLATPRPLTWRDVAPGAVAAALIWQILQSFGVLYVSHVVRHSSETNGVFAVVLGMLAFLYLASVSVVICVEANAVRVDQLHPRALLTPFTDDVDLTPGDRKAYSDQAEAQRTKSFQDIDVTFGEPRSKTDEEG
jgi:YihY family inner membrane protein